jgi:hypothetical protein
MVLYHGRDREIAGSLDTTAAAREGTRAPERLLREQGANWWRKRRWMHELAFSQVKVFSVR